MATLRREWVSVEQAEQWIATYDPKWMSEQVKDAMVEELRTGKKLRWYHAIIVDQHTNIYHDGLMKLLAIVQGRQGHRPSRHRNKVREKFSVPGHLGRLPSPASATALTASGARFLGRLGVDVENARKERRAFARQCLDWSERRAHLAGALGAAVARRCLELRWACLVDEERTLTLTPQGLRGLRKWFGISWKR